VVVENARYKDCYVPWSVITSLGRVSYDGSTDLYVILNGDLTGVHYRNEILEAFAHPNGFAVGRNFVLMDDNVCPCRACVVNEYIERERNRRTGLRPSLMLIQ